MFGPPFIFRMLGLGVLVLYVWTWDTLDLPLGYGRKVSCVCPVCLVQGYLRPALGLGVFVLYVWI